MSFLLHTIFYSLITAAAYKTSSIIDNPDGKFDIYSFFDFIIFKVIAGCLIVHLLIVILGCSFDLFCDRNFNVKLIAPRKNLPNVLALGILCYQLIKLNTFISLNLVKIDIKDWMPNNEDELEFCTSDGTNFIYTVGNVTSNPNYVKVTQALFWMRCQIYGLFSLWALYQYLRYKLDIKHFYQKQFCWYLPRLMDAYILVALDSLEFILETKTLVSCDRILMSNSMFVIL